MRRRTAARSWTLPIGCASALATLSVGAIAAPPRGAPATRPAAPISGNAQRASSGEFPSDWFWDIGGSGVRFAKMLGKAPPALKVKDWIGEAHDPTKLAGKVVIVEFWGTWCGPCMSAIPEMVKLVAERGKDGLVVIGVHDSNRGFEKVPAVVKDKGINYSVCVDDGGVSAKAYQVSFWPTITVIDRAGKIRAMGVTPAHVADVVGVLLKEPAPKPDVKPDVKPESAPAKPPEPPADGKPKATITALTA